MKKRVERLGIEIVSLDDVNAKKLEIDECGASPLENASIKALAYFRELNAPVFSCDSGLYFENLPEDDPRQPKTNIRGNNGAMTDGEVIEFYSALAKEFGGRLTAKYRHAICLVLDEKNILGHMGEDIESEKFYIVDRPHAKRSEGFPLDSLSVKIKNGKYYFDIDAGSIGDDTESDKLLNNDGFTEFFKRALGKIEYPDQVRDDD